LVVTREKDRRGCVPETDVLSTSLAIVGLLDKSRLVRLFCGTSMGYRVTGSAGIRVPELECAVFLGAWQQCLTRRASKLRFHIPFRDSETDHASEQGESQTGLNPNRIWTLKLFKHHL
jgi:hypothetical protein